LASRPEQTTDMRAVSTEPLNTAAATRLSLASAFYNALLRTTCVATMLQGGHAENALPQTAQATVNCRMLPDDNPGAVQQTLQRVVADPQIEIASLRPPTPSPPSRLRPMCSRRSRPCRGRSGETSPSCPSWRRAQPT